MVKWLAPSMAADSRMVAGIEAKDVRARMMFQMLRDPGRMTAQMLLYRPRRFITRNRCV